MSLPKCGCVAVDNQGVTYRRNINLEFCGLHDAAPDLLAAAMAVLKRFGEFDNFNTTAEADALRRAVDKAAP